jgi:hypothetical protein
MSVWFKMLVASMAVGAGAVKLARPSPGKTLHNSVTITWSNRPPLWNGVTGLMGSTNLVDWYTVWSSEARLGNVVVVLTNRPECEFYQAYNSL